MSCIVNFLCYVCNRQLIHRGGVTYIYISKLTIINSDNCFSPGWCQTIIWTNDGWLLIKLLGTNFNEITFLFKKMHFKMSSAKWPPFCPGLNVFKRLPLQLCSQSACHPLLHDSRDSNEQILLSANKALRRVPTRGHSYNQLSWSMC